MTNSNAPFGFRPVRHMTGSDQRLNKYKVASGLLETIALDDMVKSDGAGGIRKAAPGDAILGIFKGVDYQALDGSYHFEKVWQSGTLVKAGTKAFALVHDDPFETYEAQAKWMATDNDIGAFVDLMDATPDTLYGASRQTVSAAGSYVNVTAITIATPGTGYVAATTKLTVDGAEYPATFTVDGAGAITGVTPTAPLTGLAAAPVLAVTGAGTAAALTPTMSAPIVASQFRVERLLEKPQRLFDAYNNSVGYDASTEGAYALLELKPAKHERGGAAMAVAV